MVDGKTTEPHVAERRMGPLLGAFLNLVRRLPSAALIRWWGQISLLPPPLHEILQQIVVLSDGYTNRLR
jgi:hypothetical protein